MYRAVVKRQVAIALPVVVVEDAAALLSGCIVLDGAFCQRHLAVVLDAAAFFPSGPVVADGDVVRREERLARYLDAA